jgi:hypothetical protein
MAGTHNKPAAALAAGSVVLLLLLAVTPTDARKNAIMSPFNIEASRFGRNLLVRILAEEWLSCCHVQLISLSD